MARMWLAALLAITGLTNSAAGESGTRADSMPSALDTPWDPARIVIRCSKQSTATPS